MDDPVAVYSLILAISTSLLCAFTGALWWATYKLSKDAKDSATAQADKMDQSVRQASRSAKAMEGVAVSMAVNAAQIVRSVEITDGIAKVQRDFSKMQMRAYVSVLIGGGLYQDHNLRFQCDPVLLNSGNTPARDVRFKIAADVLPFNLPPDFRFPMPREWGGGNILDPQQSGSLTAVVPERIPDAEAEDVKRGVGEKSLYVWGIIEYRDVFKKRHRRTFAQRIYWIASAFDDDGNPTGWSTRGIYLPAHNRSS